jgi:hypothetical protein
MTGKLIMGFNIARQGRTLDAKLSRETFLVARYRRSEQGGIKNEGKGFKDSGYSAS